jgi:VIT1/CCC1 family predicted Fe2+/Mn2+ transporter
MRASAISFPSLIIGAAVFVVLFVILSVALWVSIVAGVAAFAASALIAGTTATSQRSPAHRA